jgi:Zn-dependent M32 family carboxypeptidase
MVRKNPAAVELGRRGGKATAQKLTPEERRENMRRVVQARGAKQPELPKEITKGTRKLLKTSEAHWEKAKEKKQR